MVVGGLRQEGFEVCAVPGDYPGHAEIELGAAWPGGDEVGDLTAHALVKKLCERLVARCSPRLLVDPRPTEPGWGGGPLCESRTFE